MPRSPPRRRSIPARGSPHSRSRSRRVGSRTPSWYRDESGSSGGTPGPAGRVHICVKHVWRGVLREAAGTDAAGTEYVGTDPNLVLWVYGVTLDTLRRSDARRARPLLRRGDPNGTPARHSRAHVARQRGHASRLHGRNGRGPATVGNAGGTGGDAPLMRLGLPSTDNS